MRNSKLGLTGSVLVLACLAFAAPVSAAPNVVKKTTVIGNNVVIVANSHGTTVTKSSSCSPGVTGTLYQTVTVLLFGAPVSVSQVTVCP